MGATIHILRFLAIFTTLVSLTSAYSEPRRCDVIGKGEICGDFLRGYYVCDGTDPYGRYNMCGSDEMCSCGLNKRCEKGKPKCIKRPEVPSVPKDFIVSFSGKVVITHPQGSAEEHLHGLVYQDYTNEKLLKSTVYTVDGKKMKKVAKLLVKDEQQQSFIEYTSTVFPDGTTHCSVRPFYKFEDLFYDLRLLSYKHSSKKFEYRNGPVHTGDSSVTQRWQFDQIHHTQLAPKYYSRVETGNQHSKVKKSLNLEYRYFHLCRPDAVTFRIPSGCKNKSVPQIAYDTNEDEKNEMSDEERRRDVKNEEDLSSLEQQLEDF